MHVWGSGYLLVEDHDELLCCVSTTGGLEGLVVKMLYSFSVLQVIHAVWSCCQYSAITKAKVCFGSNKLAILHVHSHINLTYYCCGGQYHHLNEMVVKWS